ncbi:MAG: YlxR family protein [Actinobacteria bacterium]|nr:YlxR family protein [Actinomycetota bacterium]
MAAGGKRASSPSVADAVRPQVRGRKHIPQRTCVGCRQVLSKRALVRLVRSPDGIRLDPTGKAPGRGAYLHDQRSCWEAGLRGPLAQALRTELSLDDRRLLLAHIDGLPDDADG